MHPSQCPAQLRLPVLGNPCGSGRQLAPVPDCFPSTGTPDRWTTTDLPPCLQQEMDTTERSKASGTGRIRMEFAEPTEA